MDRINAPKSLQRLKQMQALRETIDTLARGGEMSDREKLNLTAGKYRLKLDESINDMRSRIGQIESPSEELLMKLIFIDGIDKHVIRTGLGVSRQAFHKRCKKGFEALEKYMN